MENGVAHPQIEALWMGGKHVSCCYLKIFHVQKKVFLPVWSVFVKFASLWRGFQHFFTIESCSEKTFKTKDFSPPEALSFAHVPIFTFLLDASVQVKSTWISIWFALCFVQSVCTFTLSFLVLGTITRSLHFDLGKMTCLKHVNTINLGVFEASSTKGLTTPTKHKKKMPFTKRSKKAAIFYRSGSSTKRPWAVEIPPPMIPIVWSLWMGKAKKVMNSEDFFLRLIVFDMIWTYLGVSKNHGTPKWMVYKGKPY